MFEKGNFTSHAGLKLTWKIECDDLTDKDLATLAYITASRFSFFSVYGIPRGGTRFAEALEMYKTRNVSNLLLVDDVYTTGKSMVEAKLFLGHDNIIGVPIFARTNPQQDWVFPIFQLWRF